jgi:hypothetical protein
MREDRVHQLFLGGLKTHGQNEALDQFRDFGTHHVGTDEAAGLRIEFARREWPSHSLRGQHQ